MSFTSRAAALTAVAALPASLLIAISAPQQAHAASLDLPREIVAAGARVDVKAVIPGAHRPVALYVKRGKGKWKKSHKTRTDRRGAVTFKKVAVGKQKLKLRVVAPARSKQRLVKVRGRITTISPVKQTAQVQGLPPIRQQGPGPATAARGAVVTAAFTPVQPGRTVRLQRFRNGRWVGTKHASPQDKTGQVAFGTRVNARYRLVAESSATAPRFVTKPVRTKKWTTEFSDEFNGTTLDSSKWKLTPREYTAANRRCVRTAMDYVSVSDGVLRLGVGIDEKRKGTCRSYDIDGRPQQIPWMVNSQIATRVDAHQPARETFDFTYGYAAARVKVPATRGLLTSFWSQPSRDARVSPDGTEVDIFEHYGDHLGIFTTLHHNHARGFKPPVSSSDVESTPGALYSGKSSDQYLTYSWEWKPGEHVFRIDGKEFWRTDKYVPSGPQHLLLSALTPDYGARKLHGPSGDLSKTLEVDWVRVWAHPNAPKEEEAQTLITSSASRTLHLHDQRNDRGPDRSAEQP